VRKMVTTGLVCVALLSPVVGQTLPFNIATSPKDGVEGLVVNSTISATGMTFFLNFLDYWREKPGSDRYTIEIAESSSKRLGNQVWVTFGQKRVFFSALPIQRDRIRPISERAAESSYEALKILVLPFGSVLDPDVADDEL
jgi:hypothetical protein